MHRYLLTVFAHPPPLGICAVALLLCTSPVLARRALAEGKAEAIIALLKEVYEEIDKLEKTKLNVKEFSKREEEFELFAWIAFLCVLLDVLLRNTLLKKIP